MEWTVFQHIRAHFVQLVRQRFFGSGSECGSSRHAENAGRIGYLLDELAKNYTTAILGPCVFQPRFLTI